MAFSPTGQLYFADANHGVIFTVPQGGPATPVSSAIPGLQSIAFDAAGNLYASSTASGNMGLYELTPTGAVAQLISVSDNEIPSSVALDPSGNVYLVNSGDGGAPAGQILKLDRADAPSLNFPATVEGRTSASQSVTIYDIGNMPLSLSGLTVGSNFAQVPGGGTPADCTTSTNLAAGAGCNLSIVFEPTTTGATYGTATLNDNSLNANPSVTHTFQLSGTALQIAPVITWPAPAAITYGTALSGAQLNATSSVAGTFVYTPASGTVLAVGTQTLSVTFTPTDTTDYTTATKTVSLVVNEAAPGPYSQLLVTAPSPAFQGKEFLFTVQRRIPAATGCIRNPRRVECRSKPDAGGGVNRRQTSMRLADVRRDQVWPVRMQLGLRHRSIPCCQLFYLLRCQMLT
jgi:hypothetical protein